MLALELADGLVAVGRKHGLGNQFPWQRVKLNKATLLKPPGPSL